MIYYITHIKDSIGNNYLGIKFDKTLVSPFLKTLKDVEEDYDDYISNQQKRDSDSYHMTLINVMEYNKIAKEMGIDKFIKSLEKVFNYPIDDLKMMGLGTAQRNTNKTYFVVCKSDKLDAIRNRYVLPEKDFHITLGFKYKDVFGVRKNKVIEKPNNFLKLLKKEYLKNENWNFIKKIDNFKYDKSGSIIPVEIKESSIKFKIKNYYIVVSYLDNYGFRVVASFPVKKDLPRLPKTEVAKKLKL